MNLEGLTRREFLQILPFIPSALVSPPNVEEQLALLKRYEADFLKYLEQNIIRKIEREVDYIIQRGWADSVSLQDLMHAHLCFPSHLELKGTDEQQLKTMFDNYMLIYHSRERQPIKVNRNIISLPNGKIYTINFHDSADGKSHYANVVVKGKVKTIFRPRNIPTIYPDDLGYWSPGSIVFEEKNDNIFDKLMAKPKRIFEGTKLRLGITDYTK